MSDEEVKAALVRRNNVMFHALQAAEWSGGELHPHCPVCRGDKRDGHNLVRARSVGAHAYMQPCPIAFALSESATAIPTNDYETVTHFADKSEVRKYAQWMPSDARRALGEKP